MQPPVPSLTATWHNETYSAISPLRPELSSKGKTIIVVGARNRQTSLYILCQSRSSSYSCFGPSRGDLGDLEGDSFVGRLVFVAGRNVGSSDTIELKALEKVAAEVGKWDVLVIASVHASAVATLASSDIDEWWQGFATNVKGLFIAVKAFLSTANEAGSAVLTLTSQTTAFPVSMGPGMAEYYTSKIAQIKVMEYLAAEQPNIFAVTVHPGICDTAVVAQSGMKPDQLPLHQIELPGDFLVWLASPEAAFLKARSVAANELKSQSESIQAGLTMTSGIYGWPYPHTAAQ